MIDIQLTTIPFYYNEQDCKENYPDKDILIADILATIKEVLDKEITTHPIKCNFKIDYQAVFERPYGNDDSENNGLAREQSRN